MLILQVDDLISKLIYMGAFHDMQKIKNSYYLISSQIYCVY